MANTKCSRTIGIQNTSFQPRNLSDAGTSPETCSKNVADRTLATDGYNVPNAKIKAREERRCHLAARLVRSLDRIELKDRPTTDRFLRPVLHWVLRDNGNSEMSEAPMECLRQEFDAAKIVAEQLNLPMLEKDTSISWRQYLHQLLSDAAAKRASRLRNAEQVGTQTDDANLPAPAPAPLLSETSVTEAPVAQSVPPDSVAPIEVDSESHQDVPSTNTVSTDAECESTLLASDDGVSFDTPTTSLAPSLFRVRQGGLPFVQAGALQSWTKGIPWLVTNLWQSSGVGIVGGPPKSFKTYVVLDIGVSVAAGVRCLNWFDVPKSGPVLVYLAEDCEQAAYERVRAICNAKQVDLSTLPLHFIRATTLQLDEGPDFELLKETIRECRPVLLILDPLIRIHRGSENSASKISHLLGKLRSISRELDLAIIVVHHTRKHRVGFQEGQNLRGSSDLHGWGDSNLYVVRKDGRRATLTCEHRAASAQPSFIVECLDEPEPHVAVIGELSTADTEESNAPPRDVAGEILTMLRHSPSPLTRDALRARLGCRAETVSHVLSELDELGKIARQGRQGWIIAEQASENGAECAQSSGSNAASA